MSVDLSGSGSGSYSSDCSPCESCHPEFTPFNFTFTVVKALVQAVIIAWPAYKTYRALESNNLRHCQAMLAFWAVTTIMNAMKEFSDEVLAPFFDTHQQQIETVVQVAERTKKNVIEEVKEKLIETKEGMKEKLEEMGQSIKETISPSSNPSTSGSEVNSEDELIELDENGEQIVNLKQRKRGENREHLRQLSIKRKEGEQGEGQRVGMREREQEVLKEMQKELTGKTERGGEMNNNRQDWEPNVYQKEL